MFEDACMHKWSLALPAVRFKHVRGVPTQYKNLDVVYFSGNIFVPHD